MSNLVISIVMEHSILLFYVQFTFNTFLVFVQQFMPKTLQTSFFSDKVCIASKSIIFLQADLYKNLLKRISNVFGYCRHINFLPTKSIKKSGKRFSDFQKIFSTEERAPVEDRRFFLSGSGLEFCSISSLNFFFIWTVISW